MIEQGDQSVLIDPGSQLTFRNTLRKIESIIPFAFICYFICHPQDPDITGALPIIDEIVSHDDALLVAHWRARALIKHYASKLPFWLVDEHDWKLQRFYERSIRDPLTGLFTRFYMYDIVQRLFNIHDRDTNATIAVIIMDIDHFKDSNDTFGYNQGDIVLGSVLNLLFTL